MNEKAHLLSSTKRKEETNYLLKPVRVVDKSDKVFRQRYALFIKLPRRNDDENIFFRLNNK